MSAGIRNFDALVTSDALHAKIPVSREIIVEAIAHVTCGQIERIIFSSARIVGEAKRNSSQSAFEGNINLGIILLPTRQHACQS